MVDQPSETTSRDLSAIQGIQPEPVEPTVHELWQQNQALTAEVGQLRAEIEQIRQTSVQWSWVSHPLFVLAASLGASLAFAGFIIIDNDLGVSPGRHGFFLYYMVPLAAPFVAFLLDRAMRVQELRWTQWAIDLPVIVLGLVRALTALPGISGHALFLTYALFTMRSRTAQILTIIVLAEVVFLKLFAWRDPTLFGGILIAGIAALLFYLPGWKRRNVFDKRPSTNKGND